MEIALLLIASASNILCFIIGAKVGQKVVKGEPIKLPEFHPIQAIQERESKRAQEKEQERIDTIMRNIEGYDGTARGQEDVPRG